MPTISEQERGAILQALQAGVVPKRGLQHIQVGRAREVEQVVTDFRRAEDDGSVFRIFTGPYGSGKTFFLELARQVALKLGFFVLQADLAPDRRIFGAKGVARSLMQELGKNAAIDGHEGLAAWQQLFERLMDQAKAEGSGRSLRKDVADLTEQLQEGVGGYDFTTVVRGYVEAYETGEKSTMDAALRWFRAEYGTKTEAKAELGIRSIVSDDGIYDHWKNLNTLSRLAGFKGVFVCLDELVNIYKMPTARSREQNYEQILRIQNDLDQSAVPGMVVYLGGTPEFVSDARRGCYSYDALKSRLAPNPFAKDGLVDFSGPVVPLEALTREDYLVLLDNIRKVVSVDGNLDAVIDEAGLRAFMGHCENRIGAQYFQTPRESVKQFVQLLSALSQNPGTRWQDLLPSVDVEEDRGAENDKPSDDLTGFSL